MNDWQSQAHEKWDCKYHVVILPKYRRKVLYGKIRRGVGQILRDLCRQKNIELVEGKAMPDHIHMLLSVPPKVQHRDDDWVPEGQECGPDSPGAVAHERNVVRPEFLGAGLLREYRRSGRRPGPTVHPRPGKAPARS